MTSASLPALSTPMRHALSGVNAGVARLDRAATAIAAGRVDIEPMVDMMIAEQSVKQNAAVIRTADDMHKSLLDILA